MFEQFLGPAPGWAQSPWFGPLGAGIGLVSVLLWFFTPPAARLQRRVDSPHRDDRKWLRDVLGGATPFEGYIAAIRMFNARLDGWFGRRWSGQAFGRCLQLAVIYPIVLVFFGAAFGAADTADLLFSLVLLGGIGAGGLLGRFLGPRFIRIQDRVAGWLTRKLFGQESAPQTSIKIFIGGAAIIFTGALAFTSAGVLASALSDAFSSILASALAGVPTGTSVSSSAVVFAGAFTGALAFALASAFAGTLAAAFIGACTVAFALPDFLTVVGAFAVATTFFLMLPVFNAALDWMSWGVTRYFLSRAAKASSTGWGTLFLFLELLADFLIAALLLVTLAVLMPIGAELLHAIFTVERGGADWTNAVRQPLESANWTDAVRHFRREPWERGLFVTGMLITTLIPTFLHLVAGMAGVFFAWPPNAKALAQKIPYDPASENNQPIMSEIDKERIVRKLRQMRWWIAPASVLVVLIFSGFYHLFSLTGESFLTFLVNAAKCGGALAGNGACGLW